MWINVTEDNWDIILDILREEGVPEDMLEHELKRLFHNASIHSETRGILLTKDVDMLLRKLIDGLLYNGRCVLSDTELNNIKEALWQK